MQPIEDHPGVRPLVIIIGPTGVGKTEVAIQLAVKLKGEIISADSRLFYRGMDIGTAKPTQEERKLVTHHLIDVADPDEPWNLAKFQSRVHPIIEQVQSRGNLPFLVGGTGQFIWSVANGWKVPLVKPDPIMRAALERWAEKIGREGLYRRLVSLDPIAADRIHARNLRRTVRALEVILKTGQLFSKQKQSIASPYQIYPIGLTRPREELYQRIDSRLENMLASGFIDEVKALLESGYEPGLSSFSAIGYREITEYLAGNIDLDETKTRIIRATRIFVRRQYTWFKLNDHRIHWFNITQVSIQEIEESIRFWLRSFNNR